MIQKDQKYVPILTSSAGLCLTAANWNEVGVTTATFYLDSLLLKPGYALLKKIDNLGYYLGWQGRIVLNASTLKASKQGLFQIVSPYDGSKIKLSAQELIELVIHLKPNVVLLPAGITQGLPEIWKHWPEGITPFLSAEEPLNCPLNHGLYFKSTVSLEKLDQYKNIPSYVMSDMDTNIIEELKNKEVDFIESDAPAHMALHGVVYYSNGEMDIKDNARAQQFELIDPNCSCPTCTQSYSKAYLHHLFWHTPLLAQRFLMQHNAFYAHQITS